MHASCFYGAPSEVGGTYFCLGTAPADGVGGLHKARMTVLISALFLRLVLLKLHRSGYSSGEGTPFRRSMHLLYA